MRRAVLSGSLLVIASVLILAGIALFVLREYSQFDQFVLERGLVLAAWLVAAAGTSLMGTMREDFGSTLLLRAGGWAFAVGALVAAFAETTLLSDRLAIGHELALAFVILLFVGLALIGGGLFNQHLVPAWVGWAVVVWNVGWLVTLFAVSTDDPYYPGLHALPLLLLGISLVRTKARRPDTEPTTHRG
jgi:hypothetical protein